MSRPHTVFGNEMLTMHVAVIVVLMQSCSTIAGRCGYCARSVLLYLLFLIDFELLTYMLVHALNESSALKRLKQTS